MKRILCCWPVPPFKGGPGLPAPVCDGCFVTLTGPPGGLLPTPPDGLELAAHIAGMTPATKPHKAEGREHCHPLIADES
jgi:hypothetical protein